MNYKEKEKYLIDYLLNEAKLNIDQFDYSFKTYRMLENIREPKAINKEFIRIQNEYLKEIIETKGITDAKEIVTSKLNIWKGDITTLHIDAIVNAANNQMLGCFMPNHNCIDNAIHTFAGIELRNECDRIMKKQGHLEESGKALLTNAYNLPCHYILHTVGPIIRDRVTKEDCVILENCYKNCLALAQENGIKNIAFCCISTGVFAFPKEKACEIAIKTVSNYLKNNESAFDSIVFNVFEDEDYDRYEKHLKMVCDSFAI